MPNRLARLAALRGGAAFSWKAFVLGALAMLAGGLLAQNLTSTEERIERQVPRLYDVADPQFERALGQLLGPPVIGGNRHRALHNGDEIFPAMLAAIRGARQSVTFETYIYWSGDIGRAFADALTERARAGVAVHVLLDWVGSAKIDDAFLDGMRAAGVQVEKFHEPHWSHWGRLNNRTHRKLLVVDGRIGFTGGVGIAPAWEGNAQSKDHWRDSHFQVEGPVVAQMQAVFLDNWMKASGAVLHGERYFPKLEAQGDERSQLFSSSPSGGSESMQLMYLLSITSAARSIDLAMAYFVPDAMTRRALVAALQRGVVVRIVVPGTIIDTQTVRAASRADWGELLEAGARIHEYQPTMFHCKMMVVDGLLVSVGSTNFDNRSFRLNDEANLNVFDTRFAAAQTATFERDLAASRRITLDAWRARPWGQKLQERAASLLSPQL